MRNNLSKKADILIIGSGIAGVSAASYIRDRGQDVSVSIVSNESYLPYYRTKLCNYINGNLKDNSLFIHPEPWYKEKDIELILSSSVTNIDDVNRKVALYTGEDIYFNKLIIASGSHSFIPDKYKDYLTDVGFHCIRNIDDIIKINSDIAIDGSWIVIGGGLLGLEAAYNIKKTGKDVTIIEAMPRLLANSIDETASNLLERKVKSLGINILYNVSIDKISYGGNRKTLILNNNSNKITTDFIVFALGVRSSMSFIKQSSIKYNRGIIVNNHMETNIDGVYAAGDVAEFNGKAVGLWSIANNQGKIAGANAIGENIEYIEEESPCFLNTMGTMVYKIGNIKVEGDNENVQCLDEEKYSYKKLFFKDNILVGAILFGDIKDSLTINKAIKNKDTKESVIHKIIIN